MLALGVGNAWAVEETESYTCAKGTIVDNSMTWNLTSCTIEHEKAESSNALAVYAPWRIYAKQTITITPKSGITITKMVITSTTDAYATAGTKTWTNATATSSSTSITVIPTDGTSKFVYTNANSGQTRWQSVVITYTSGGTEPPTPAKTYDVTWMVNGEEWAISEDVEENTQITTLPTEPTDECAGKVFQGWTDKEITDGQKPAVLFKDKSPKITDDLTFYAVFATETNSGSGNLTTTFTPNVDDLSTGKNGITIKMSNTAGASGYYQIFKSSSMTITSENAITSFTITCTASDKSKYGPGNITFTEGTYSYSGTTGTWTGNATSLTSGNAAEQLRIKSIVVTTSGGSTISDYITTCSGSGETVVSLIPKKC